MKTLSWIVGLCLTTAVAASVERRGVWATAPGGLSRPSNKKAIGAKGSASTLAVQPHQQQPPRGGNVASLAPSQGTLVVLGCALALNSGLMNGLALSGSLLPGKKQAVAAVTGAWTNSALGAAESSVDTLLAQLVIILSYFGGSCLNGMLYPNGIQWASSSPPLTLFVAAALVAAGYLLCDAAAAAKPGLWSTLRVWVCLTMANGLQNSWTSSLIAGNVLRTTHYSGMTSDMGTFAGQILRGNTTNGWKLRIFALLAISFWTGSFTALTAGKQLSKDGLLINIGIYLTMAAYLMARQPKVQAKLA